MRSTEAISASVYPFLEPFWQGIDKKQHPDSGKRRFQALMGDPMGSIGFEISTNCNDTGREVLKSPAWGWVSGRDPA